MTERNSHRAIVAALAAGTTCPLTLQVLPPPLAVAGAVLGGVATAFLLFRTEAGGGRNRRGFP
ncbi:hypothetical protein SAMN05216574_107151 [Blastococcus tunisiensis]|uniref:XapX domain-containing protein n=1 Tax=Blastococcus tunisiensis TaxID=1798228 RepID=A0A1I2EPI7_9ACTN|nr:hypothetical protein SAMN05216574_107151 [Blastococcus sp. DSM 46838]